MTPTKKQQEPHDGQVDECTNIFVSWSKFTTILLSFVVLALLISFSFGSTEVTIKRDIVDVRKNLSEQDARLQILEENQNQLELISKKIDQLLQRNP